MIPAPLKTGFSLFHFRQKKNDTHPRRCGPRRARAQRNRQRRRRQEAGRPQTLRGQSHFSPLIRAAVPSVRSTPPATRGHPPVHASARRRRCGGESHTAARRAAPTRCDIPTVTHQAPRLPRRASPRAAHPIFAADQYACVVRWRLPSAQTRTAHCVCVRRHCVCRQRAPSVAQTCRTTLLRAREIPIPTFYMC